MEGDGERPGGTWQIVRLRLVYGCSFVETGERGVFGVRGCSRVVLASGPCSFCPVFEPQQRRVPRSPPPPFGLFYEADSPGPARAEVPRAFRGLFTPESSLSAPELPEAGHSTAFALHDPVPSADPATTPSPRRGSIAWRSLLRDSIVLLLVQQSYRITFEDSGTRENLKGPFFEEWFASVSTLCCWDDGDRMTTNYLFHPLMGSTAAFVFANNHRASQETPIGNNSRYWKAKGAQGLYSFIYSLNFEIGPLSEASIGNVGLKPGEMTYCDFVVTPGIGLLISIGEDAARLHIIDRVKRSHLYWGNTLAVLLNPTRSVANVMGGKAPWRGPAWSESGRTR